MRQNGLQDFQQSVTQTSHLSYRDQLEKWKLTSTKFSYDTFQRVNNKGTDQSAQMHRLICIFVVTNPEDRFSNVKSHIMDPSNFNVYYQFINWLESSSIYKE